MSQRSTVHAFFALSLAVTTITACATKKSSDREAAKKPAANQSGDKESLVKLDNDGDGKPDDAAGTAESPTGAAVPPILQEPAPLPPAPNPEDECYKGEPEVCAVEAEIWRLTNELRTQNGRPPFRFSAKVSWVSRQWSSAQAQRGSIGHAGFPGQRSREYQTEFSERFGMGGENVAMTGVGAIDSVAQQFFDMWKRSPGHRANMLGRYGVLGVGVAKGRWGWYGTQIMGDE